MTGGSRLAGFGRLLDLSPSKRTPRPASHLASDSRDVEVLEETADNGLRLLFAYAKLLELGSSGLIDHIKVSEVEAKLHAMSLTVVPDVPFGVRGLALDRAKLARDRVIVTNRHAGTLVAEYRSRRLHPTSRNNARLV